jgi:hypothetical protein
MPTKEVTGIMDFKPHEVTDAKAPHVSGKVTSTCLLCQIGARINCWEAVNFIECHVTALYLQGIKIYSAC